MQCLNTFAPSITEFSSNRMNNRIVKSSKPPRIKWIYLEWILAFKQLHMASFISKVIPNMNENMHKRKMLLYMYPKGLEVKESSRRTTPIHPCITLWLISTAKMISWKLHVFIIGGTYFSNWAQLCLKHKPYWLMGDQGHKSLRPIEYRSFVKFNPSKLKNDGEEIKEIVKSCGDVFMQLW